MCGYVGEVSLEPRVCEKKLERMSSALSHRGPDERGIILASDRRWGVSHRRLAVLDPVGGKQPMVLADRGITLVYNGQIYDHERLRDELADKHGYPFRTRSDTEVLLALYAVHGLGMFPYLRGEFSFAIVDERKREAYLVRDRMGLKPLFYTRTAQEILFASEIKALFRSPDVGREIDPRNLVAAIAVADLPGETVFRGIRQVRHARYLRIQLDTLETSEHRYWDALENAARDLPTDRRERVALVRSEVEEAIRLRLRADVPVGTYLSGGLDSSLVTGVMAGKVDRLEAFGIAFEDSPRHNEFTYAQAVAERFPNVHLHRIPITHADMVDKLEETVWHLERPFGNLHSAAKVIASQFARRHVTCVLTGDGGDESFCGYSTHLLQDLLERCEYNPRAARAQIQAMRKEAKGIGGNRYYLTGGLARRIGPETAFFEKKLGFRPCDLAVALDNERILAFLHPDHRKAMELGPVRRLVDHLAKELPPDAAQRMPHAALLQYIQFNSSVPEYIAAIADRSEFAGSVEARPPLFDHRVVELAMGLPITDKIEGDREKAILREAFADLLPNQVIERRKQAFLAPPAPFTTPAGRELLERYLSPEAIRASGLWNPRYVAWLNMARACVPRSRILNVLTTTLLTSQILHHRFVIMGSSLGENHG